MSAPIWRPNGGAASTPLCDWWPSTVDRRYWYVSFDDPFFAQKPVDTWAVVDDFGNLVAVKR